jgi:hypothetical protein
MNTHLNACAGAEKTFPRYLAVLHHQHFVLHPHHSKSYDLVFYDYQH